MHPDPPEIILDYRQSHIFYHLQFISSGSSQHEVRLTFHIMTQDKKFSFLFLKCRNRRQNVHSGFEAKYNMKTFV